MARTTVDNLDTIEPGTDIVAVAKSDTVADPNGPFRGLVMDAVGAVKLTMASGQARTIPSGVLAAGVIHPLRFSRVWSTGTGTQTIYGIV
jgi:hypothetical protein